MYEEYLGECYHDKIREKMTADEVLLPNRIIDADVNIGAMKEMLSPVLEGMSIFGNAINSEEKFNQLSDVALHYLCGILCMAMKSRTSAPPFNITKYKRNWDKKQKKFIQRGNMLIQGLMKMG